MVLLENFKNHEAVLAWAAAAPNLRVLIPVLSPLGSFIGNWTRRVTQLQNDTPSIK